LALKGLRAEPRYVHLRKGEQRSADYLALNPQGLVPTLADDDGTIVGQSLAIIEYLEETRPPPPPLPEDSPGRAPGRQLADGAPPDLQPLNNLRVLNYLTESVKVSEAQRLQWYRHWTATGLAALEALLAGSPATGTYCHGERPGLADCCLVPQVYNAE